MDADRQYVVADEVLVVPVGRLPRQWRVQLADDQDGFAAVRPGSRQHVRLLDAEAGYLLRQFAEPRSLREALAAYCTATGEDVQAVEPDAEQLVRHLLADQILVDPHAPQPEDQALAAGTCWDGRYHIVDLVTRLQDRDVYRAVHLDGRPVALKISALERGAAAFDREADLLDHLAGTVSPRLVEHGASGPTPPPPAHGLGIAETAISGCGRGFLAMEWIDGESLRAASRPLVARLVDHDDDVAADQLGQLVVAMLDAYRTLHAHDVVHGDIHPSNIRVAVDRGITLIDFDQATRGPGPLVDEHRRGVSRYYEPELAAARLGGRPIPAATPASDQYALGVVAYKLLTGQHYLPLAADHEQELRHIAHDPPRPVPPRSARRWPGLEPVLQRALAKDPTQRYPSLAHFHDHLVANLEN